MNTPGKWDERFSAEEYIYGKEPNAFFKSFIDTNPPGRILLPAEGEGRNAVYAALHGWEVTAFDFSKEARMKALKLAAEAGVTIRYEICDLDHLVATNQATAPEAGLCPEGFFDAIGLFAVHMAPPLREKVHRILVPCLKPGGYLLLEAFNKKQIRLNTGGQADERTGEFSPSPGGEGWGGAGGQADERRGGGPKDVAMLYSVEELASDFSGLDIIELREFQDNISAGIMHNGLSERIRLFAKKPQPQRD